jgi:ATP-dependent Lon protease
MTSNRPCPAFRESSKVGEQNLYSRAKSLVGDRDPRGHEYSVQLRAMDNDRSGAGLGLPILVALVGGLLERNTRGSTIVVGSLNLGGSIEMIPNPISLAELAVEKRAKTLLIPISARRGLNDLPDELAAKIQTIYYIDSEDAVFKCLDE